MKMVCRYCGGEAIETKPGLGFYKHKLSWEDIPDIGERRTHVRLCEDHGYHIFAISEETWKVIEVLEKLDRRARVA